jgi:hypothetical protein
MTAQVINAEGVYCGAALPPCEDFMKAWFDRKPSYAKDDPNWVDRLFREMWLTPTKVRI